MTFSQCCALHACMLSCTVLLYFAWHISCSASLICMYGLVLCYGCQTFLWLSATICGLLVLLDLTNLHELLVNLYSMGKKPYPKHHWSHGHIFWKRLRKRSSSSTHRQSMPPQAAMPRVLNASSSDMACNSAGAVQRAMLPALSGIEAQLMEITCLGTTPS